MAIAREVAAVTRLGIEVILETLHSNIFVLVVIVFTVTMDSTLLSYQALSFESFLDRLIDKV